MVDDEDIEVEENLIWSSGFSVLRSILIIYLFLNHLHHFYFMGFWGFGVLLEVIKLIVALFFGERLIAELPWYVSMSTTVSQACKYF